MITLCLTFLWTTLSGADSIFSGGNIIFWGKKTAPWAQQTR